MPSWLWLLLVPLTVNAIHIPLYSGPRLQRRGQAAQIGLGDDVDVTYAVQLNVGGTLMPLVLDTGSSDLWAVTTACTGCKTSSLSYYPQANVKSTGLDISLLYGDSLSGTHANGVIAVDNISVAGLTADKQYFAAIDDTNATVIELGTAGIFGLGFPINSFVWSKVFKAQNSLIPTRSIHEEESDLDFARSEFPSLGSLYPGHKSKRHSSNAHFRRARFPALDSLYPTTLESRQDSNTPTAAQQSWTQTILDSFPSIGPPIARLTLSNSSATRLSDNTFTISLQRDTITNDPTETIGLLSIGEFPNGITNNSFTWSNLRLYTPDQGGIYSPSSSPLQVYPIAWEVYIDDVYLDGQVLPRSTLTPFLSSIGLSALVDTGNSLIRGPQDIVQEIRKRVSPANGGETTFDCSTPHSLAFKINGQMFPVDPRDLVAQAYEQDTKNCILNVVPTDPPAEGKGYKYSWSFGTPFLKSVMTSYHYGNITHPLSDPPRVGFMSTVPQDADQKLKDSVAAATGGNLFATSNPAPTGLPTGPGGSTLIALPTGSTDGAHGNGAVALTPRLDAGNATFVGVFVVWLSMIWASVWVV